MDIAPLPENPDLDRLKGHAKLLRDLVRSGAEESVALVRARHPRLGDLAAGSPAATSFKLADAQLTLARHYGLASWAKLRRHIETVNALTRSPHEVGPLDDAGDELLRLACLTYGDNPPRPVEARSILAARPEVARSSVFTMAAVGDHAALASALDADAAAVHREGGPFGWEPLLYVAYSRLDSDDPAHDALATARVLLERGADPNAGYLWAGLIPPFTALTGALGGGEQQQPPHRRWRELATLLLDAGADPNDGQAIYNRGLGDMAGDDTEHLELLFDHGLGRGDGGPWHRRLAPGEPFDPANLVAEVLQHAAAAGLPRRARLALDRGADPNRRYLHPCFEGRTPLQSAVRNGNADIADMLIQAGADRGVLDAMTLFVGACLSGQRADVDAALAGDPGLLAHVIEREPDLIVTAATLGRVDAVRLLASLGYDVNVNTSSGRTALHKAAIHGNDELARVLIALGADPTIKDSEYDATPAGWATHAGHTALAAYLEGLATPGRS